MSVGELRHSLTGEPLTPEDIVLQQSSPLEIAQWRAWKQGFQLPSIDWSFVDEQSSSSRPKGSRESHKRSENSDTASFALPCHSDGQDFHLTCRIKALEELYEEGFSETDTHEPFVEGQENDQPCEVVSKPSQPICLSPQDVTRFEQSYSNLVPLLNVHSRIVANRKGTAVSQAIETESRLAERRSIVRALGLIEDQLEFILGSASRKVSNIRNDCILLRARMDAMSSIYSEPTQLSYAPINSSSQSQMLDPLRASAASTGLDQSYLTPISCQMGYKGNTWQPSNRLPPSAKHHLLSKFGSRSRKTWSRDTESPGIQQAAPPGNKKRIHDEPTSEEVDVFKRPREGRAYLDDNSVSGRFSSRFSPAPSNAQHAASPERFE